MDGDAEKCPEPQNAFQYMRSINLWAPSSVNTPKYAPERK